MDVRTGSKSWGYYKRPRNWKKIMYKEIDDEPEVDEIIPEVEEVEEIIPEVEEVEEVEEIIEEKPPKIGESRESGARIEKPKITARVSKPLPRPLVDPALLDSSFSHI